MRPKLVVCASGAGSNFAALLRATKSNRLPADIVGLITNRKDTGAARLAEASGVPLAVLRPRDFDSIAAWDLAMCARLKSWRADWVVLAGFLALIGTSCLDAFKNRIVNIHPSLLPKYGGPGMYGDKVFAAVLAAHERETGITVHTIDERYDRGQILAQTKVNVEPGDTVQTLANRIHQREHEFYAEVLIKLIATNPTDAG